MWITDTPEELETDFAAAKAGLCNIHGVWLSPWAGVAIELLPTMRDGHIEIQAKLYNLDPHKEHQIISNGKPRKKALLSSGWTGRGLISPERPTTLTIIFQKRISQVIAFILIPKELSFSFSLMPSWRLTLHFIRFTSQ